MDNPSSEYRQFTTSQRTTFRQRRQRTHAQALSEALTRWFLWRSDAELNHAPPDMVHERSVFLKPKLKLGFWKNQLDELRSRSWSGRKRNGDCCKQSPRPQRPNEPLHIRSDIRNIFITSDLILDLIVRVPNFRTGTCLVFARVYSNTHHRFRVP